MCIVSAIVTKLGERLKFQQDVLHDLEFDLWSGRIAAAAVYL